MGIYFDQFLMEGRRLLHNGCGLRGRGSSAGPAGNKQGVYIKSGRSGGKDTYNGTSDTMQIGQILDTGVFCFIWADLGTN